MSELYPEYFGTVFPDALDRWENMMDVTIETKPVVDQFYRYYNAGDFDSAARIIEENPILRRMIINADNMNQIRHGVMALERFFYEDVERYLMYIVKPRGDFDPGQKYTKYDVVFIAHDDAKECWNDSEDDYIVGIVSATPSVVGDNFSDDWKGKYVRDVFGAAVPDGENPRQLSPEFNPDIDNDYVSRLDRSEWDAVGMMGKLVAVDDGTCVVNGYCKPSDGGIATASETGYRVLRRIDDSHIKILLK